MLMATQIYILAEQTTGTIPFNVLNSQPKALDKVEFEHG